MTMTAATRPNLRAAAAALLAGLLAWIPPAQAAPPAIGRVPVVGFLAFNAKGCRNANLERGLRELGYTEGQHYRFDCRHADGRYEGLDAAARGLVAARPDVVVVYGHAATLSMHRATADIPIVMLASGEPVAVGFARSLAHPGGNMTGVTDYTIELNIKRLELLKSAVPTLRRLAILVHSGLPADLAAAFLRDSEAAGRQFGFSVHVVNFARLDDLAGAFDAMEIAGDQALLVAPMREVPAETARLIELSHKHNLPTVHLRKSFVVAGGFMSYGVDYAQLQHRTAFFVDQILNGARPADMPIEQPARFELYINSTSARLLGVELPESLMLRADEVVE